jgi:hypothetical protein
MLHQVICVPQEPERWVLAARVRKIATIYCFSNQTVRVDMDIGIR